MKASRGAGERVAASGRTSTAEMGDLERLEVVGGGEPEDAADEVERRLERPADVLLPAEAVALALACDVRVRDALPLEDLDHRLGLVGRHDLVVEALQEQQRPLEAVREVHRRALAVEVGTF